VNRRELMLLLMDGAMDGTARPSRPAQQKATPVIGFLGVRVARPVCHHMWPRFQQGLERGRVHRRRKNVAIEYRWAAARYDQLPALSTDLVGNKVDVIATSSFGALAAKKCDIDDFRSSPSSATPVASGPGRQPRPAGRQRHWLQHHGNRAVAQAASSCCPISYPRPKVVACLMNPKQSGVRKRVMRGVQEAARVNRLQLEILTADTESEIDAAFANPRRTAMPGALLVADPLFDSRRREAAGGRWRRRLCAVPATMSGVEYCRAAGGLDELWARASPGAWRQVWGPMSAGFSAGAKPADLPVQQPTRFRSWSSISKTAKTTRPSPCRHRSSPRADEVHRMNRREFMLILGGAMTAARRRCAPSRRPMPVIGILGAASPGPIAADIAAFRQGLSENWLHRGTKCYDEYRWAEGHSDRAAGTGRRPSSAARSI